MSRKRHGARNEDRPPVEDLERGLRVVFIPLREVRKFMSHASRNWRVGEVGGMFAMREGKILYLPGENILPAPDRMSNIELKAEWIAEQVSSGWDCLAFAHSHPNGDGDPSETDWEHFPWWMCKTAFIWAGDADRITQYWWPQAEGGNRRTVVRRLDGDLGISIRMEG